MPNTVKVFIKGSIISFFLFLPMTAIGALILMKFDVEENKVHWLIFGFNALISLILAMVFRKEDNAFFSLTGLLLINGITPLIMRHFTVHTLISFGIILLVYFGVIFVSKRRRTAKNNSMKKLRRDYEKLRKK